VHASAWEREDLGICASNEERDFLAPDLLSGRAPRMLSGRWLSCAVIPLLLGCSAAPGSEPSPSASSGVAGRACGQFSDLAQTVIDAASEGASTVPRVDWHYNTVESGPIIGGEAFATAMTNLVTQARSEVIIESFIIQDTWITGQLAAAIAQIDPSIPVYVNVTTDTGSPANFHTEQETADNVLARLDPDRSHNVIVAAWEVENLLPTGIDHDKLVIVDRSMALVSNINMESSADPLWYGPDANGWYQMGVVVEGEIAGVLASEATNAWTHAGAISASQPGAANTTAIPTRTAPGGKGCTPVVALGREVDADENSSADQGFVALFGAASQTLRIQTPNLNDPAALAALAAATNDADVYVVLSEGFSGWEEDLAGGSNVSIVGNLDDTLASADPCRMHVRWYASADNPGVAIDGTHVDLASHAKYASADGQAMILGSQNMDEQSWQTSRELSVLIDDPKTTASFDAAFQAVWDRGACAYECGGCD
jgi:phosphatidylserine/phosphatidylglycerophosphate/cardiolipin synthase-like enzyme